MTEQVYRPEGSGGLLQLKSGTKWYPILGVQSIAVSGGDRETSTFETLDGGVESTFGAAGVKDIALTLNPSFMNAYWRQIIMESYYGNDTIDIRYRTLASVNDIAKGEAANGISIAKIDPGFGKEAELSFEKDAAGSPGEAAGEAIQASGELGIITKSTSIADSDRTDAKPADGLFYSVRYDSTDEKYYASSWNGVGLKTAISDQDDWVLFRYGIAFEWKCRVTSGANPDLATNAAIGETLNLRQVASGMNIYPILKQAS